MKRYIAQYAPWTGGLYVVMDTYEGGAISDPKPYHDANDEAEERNNGTFGQPKPTDQAALDAYAGFSGWFATLPDAP